MRLIFIFQKSGAGCLNQSRLTWSHSRNFGCHPSPDYSRGRGTSPIGWRTASRGVSGLLTRATPLLVERFQPLAHVLGRLTRPDVGTSWTRETTVLDHTLQCRFRDAQQAFDFLRRQRGVGHHGAAPPPRAGPRTRRRGGDDAGHDVDDGGCTCRQLGVLLTPCPARRQLLCCWE